MRKIKELIEKQNKKKIRKMIKYDIEIGRTKIVPMLVEKIAVGGGYIGQVIEEDEIIEYIVSNLGDVEKIIPSNLEENKSFYNYLSWVKNIYKDKINIKRNEKYTQVALIIGVLSLIVSLIK